MHNLHYVEADSTEEHPELNEAVQLTLAGIADAAKEGLLALSVGAGLAVLHELIEEEVDEVVGPKGRWDADRDAKRHGHTKGEVTLVVLW